ncbi:MAG TPA: IS481 family transposase [Gemmatimonadaceae bacterium]|nr:IS481 family transposase [Gemmatimonadaceae bacterium]
MQMRLHKNATTTPKVRAMIQSSDLPKTELARQFGVSIDTINKWKARDSVADRSHTAHRLQTTLNAGQEEIVVVLREMLWLPLDDLLAVVREFIEPAMSRSALDRLLQRREVGSLRDLRAKATPVVAAPAAKAFKAYVPGFVHVDVKYLPQMIDETGHRYLFVAIDRATRWVHIALYPTKTAANARRFLARLVKAAPFAIEKILTDNGREFTDRFVTTGERTPTGDHAFDRLCMELGIEHRLTRPRHPQTNGMVERFNGRIADLLKTHRFVSGEDLETTLLRYAWLYNHQLPQAALNHQSPIQAMQQWESTHPHLFHRKVGNRAGCDT